MDLGSIRKTKEQREYLIKASSLCLLKPLTHELLLGEGDELTDFLLNNRWKPFENFTTHELYAHISDIAYALQGT